MALSAAAMILGTALATPAQAGIPIPCTGEKLIKISEQGHPRSDGSVVYLGYKAHCFGGEWVGYLSDRNYVKLPDATDEATIAQAFGYDKLPSPPGVFSDPLAFWVEWLWMAILLIGGASSAVTSGRTEAEA
jgi:hypothetical protein